MAHRISVPGSWPPAMDEKKASAVFSLFRITIGASDEYTIFDPILDDGAGLFLGEPRGVASHNLPGGAPVGSGGIGIALLAAVEAGVDLIEDFVGGRGISSQASGGCEGVAVGMVSPLASL